MEDMSKHEHNGHRSRIRDRVRKEGLDNFYNYQVLEYVLSFVVPYKDTNPLAHRLINKFGSLANVFEAGEDMLSEVDGLGEVSAHFLANFIKIYAYYEKEKINKDIVLKGPDNTREYVSGLFKGTAIEEFYLVLLTPKNKVIDAQKLSVGSDVEVNVTIRQIMNSVVINKAYNVIVAHNHPRGKAIPTNEDNNFTKALVTTLALNNCNLLDHVIVGQGDYFSYRESGGIDKYYNEISYLVKNNFAYNNSPQPTKNNIQLSKTINNSDNNKTTKIKKDGINIDYFYNISLGSDEVEDD